MPSGLVGAVAGRQWQVCFYEQLQGSSGKCFGEDCGWVAVASVFAGLSSCRVIVASILVRTVTGLQRQVC